MNIESTQELVEKTGGGQINFVLLAAKVARMYNLGPGDAIRKLESGEITREEIEEAIVNDFRKPVPEPEVEIKEDNPNLYPLGD